jgi:hypothetical protein
LLHTRRRRAELHACYGSACADFPNTPELGLSLDLGSAVLCQSLLLLLAAACHAPPAHVGRSTDAGEISGTTLDWQSARALLGADGLSQRVSFAFHPDARAFALRAHVTGAVSTLPCFAFEDVMVNGDTSWVGSAEVADYGDYCIQCAQRVSVGVGYALSILPSAADASFELSAVSARVALRDCSTLTPQRTAALGMPGELIMEAASWQPPAADAQVRLPLAVVVATHYGFANDPTLLPDALASMQRIWSAARIELELAPSVTISPPASVLTYSATDQTALRELARAAREALSEQARDPRSPVLILGPCLRRNDVISGGQSQPWAYTPHLPGGSGVGEEPDQIFIATERCEGLSPLPSFDASAQLGAVMAHELGHYLGLYHVKEADGRQDDLSDTDTAALNLMQVTPSASAMALSQSQIDIARRHNAFAVSPHLKP